MGFQCVYKIKRIDVIHGCGTREFVTGNGTKYVIFDDDFEPSASRPSPSRCRIRQWRLRTPPNGTGSDLRRAGRPPKTKRMEFGKDAQKGDRDCGH